KLFDDSLRKKSADFPEYCDLGGRSGFGARHILYYLTEKCGAPVNQLSIARLTNLTPPTVCVALKKMEAKGLIQRTPNPDDMRQTMVSVTERGVMLQRFMQESIRETQEQMFRDFSPEEISALCAALRKIRKNMTGSEAPENIHDKGENVC
ncbi:MAG: MarR family winged helix-turn-helix transcriptional regulator, partial [Oscillospiraceae bacterium]